MRSLFFLALFGAACANELRYHAMITAAPAAPVPAMLRKRQAAECDAGQTACTDTGCCPVGSPCTTSLGKPVCGGAGAFCATTCPDGFCCGIGKRCTTDSSGGGACAGNGLGGAFPSFSVPSFSAPDLSDFESSLSAIISGGSGGGGISGISDFGAGISDINTATLFGNSGGNGGSNGGGGGDGGRGFAAGGGNGATTPTRTINAAGHTASKMVHEGIWGYVLVQVAAIVGIAAYVL